MSELQVSQELASTFDETFDRYRYLERIAIANAVNPGFVFGVMDASDLAAYRRTLTLSDAEVDEVMAEHPGELLDNEDNRYHDGDVAEEKYSADLIDVMGIVGDYTADYIASTGEVWLKTLTPDGSMPAITQDKDRDPHTYVRFGTYDEGVETDFQIEKIQFTDRGVIAQTMLVEDSDVQAVEMAVSKLHAALFRITGVEEANRLQDD